MVKSALKHEHESLTLVTEFVTILSLLYFIDMISPVVIVSVYECEKYVYVCVREPKKTMVVT